MLAAAGGIFTGLPDHGASSTRRGAARRVGAGIEDERTIQIDAYPNASGLVLVQGPDDRRRTFGRRQGVWQELAANARAAQQLLARSGPQRARVVEQQGRDTVSGQIGIRWIDAPKSA